MNVPKEIIEKFVGSAADESPLPLRSCWLDLANSRLLATDGHYAMKVGVEIGEGDTDGPVPVEVFDLARKELKIISKIQGKDVIPDPWVNVTCGEQTVLIRNLLTNTVHSVDRPSLAPSMKFPNVDAVFKELSGPPTITLSIDLLARVLKNIDPMAPAVSFWVNAPDTAVTIATATSTGAVILMPMRSDLEAAHVNSRAKIVKQQVEDVALA